MGQDFLDTQCVCIFGIETWRESWLLRKNIKFFFNVFWVTAIFHVIPSNNDLLIYGIPQRPFKGSGVKKRGFWAPGQKICTKINLRKSNHNIYLCFVRRYGHFVPVWYSRHYKEVDGGQGIFRSLNWLVIKL